MSPNLSDRDAAIALSELSGKLSIREIRDFAKTRGLIVTPDDLVERYELDQTRKLIQRVRHFERPDGKGPVELVNLFDTDEEGRKIQYYKPVHEATVGEDIQLCTYWFTRGRYCDRQLFHYVKLAKRKHGRRFQRMLPFDLPPVPAPAAAEG